MGKLRLVTLVSQSRLKLGCDWPGRLSITPQEDPMTDETMTADETENPVDTAEDAPEAEEGPADDSVKADNDTTDPYVPADE